MVARNDGGGAYYYNPLIPNPGNAGGTGVWVPIVNANSMPSNTFGFDGSNNFLQLNGVTELRIAPSNTQIFYMLYQTIANQGNAWLLKSTNRGQTWTLMHTFTSLFNPTFGQGDFQNNYAQNNYKMAVDPANANTVLIGTATGGLYYTTDGGATLTQISTGQVPASLADSNSINPVICGIAFDPSSGTTGGNTNTAYCVSFGNGTYQTTATVSGTWSKLTGGPSYVEDALVSGGVYYAAGGSSSGITGAGQNTTLVKYSSGSFSTIHTDGGGIHSLTVNPNDGTNIVYSNGFGQISQTSDSGTTWFSYTGSTITLSATDCPWLGTIGSGILQGISGKLLFDQSVAHKIWQSTGTGFWNTASLTSSSLASNSPITWNSVSAGIESLDGCKIVSTPGGTLIDAGLDFQLRYHPSLSAFPTTFGVSGLGAPVTGCMDIDYAKDGSGYMAAICNSPTGNNHDASGFSNNNGQTWTKFTNKPTNSGVTAGGMIAMANSSSVVAWVTNATNVVYLTSLTGTWSNASGLPGTGWPTDGYEAGPQVLCADAAQNYYILNFANGLYKSTNGGANWTQIDATSLAGALFQARLEAVPGVAQMLFFTAGQLSGGYTPTNLFYYRVNDADTWHSMSNVEDVWAFGFGAAAPGFSNPTMFIVGHVNKGAGYVYGIWVSKDATTTPGSATWTLLTTWPGGNTDRILSIDGDYNDHTRCYLAFSQSGFGYGKKLSY